MTILNEDIKLYESQKLTDDPDGGGRATGNEVVDGAVNNLFPDISRLDRTIGDVALRKVFVGVATANRDTYLGAHAILTNPPADPRARICLFDTDSESDERADAREYIERYLVKGPAAPWELLGNQLEGQMSVIGVQREEQDIPEIGDTYALYDPDTENEQYIRVTDVEHSIETFTIETGGGYTDFERRKVTLSISSTLTHTFPGGTPTPAGTTSPKSSVNETVVTDAARYYGATPLDQAASIGDLTVYVNTVFESLVPSAQSETAVTDEQAGYQTQAMIAAASSPITEVVNATESSSGVPLNVYVSRPVLPGSLSISSSLFDGLTDDEKGNLFHPSKDNLTGSVDYSTGTLTLVANTDFGDKFPSVTYTPAAPLLAPAITDSVEIVEGNRGFVYNLNLAGDKPKPGTLQVAYLSLGKWQTIRDPGNGEMEGAGAGAIDFQTGTVSLTLANLPDVNTAIVYSYQTTANEEHTLGTGSVGTYPSATLQLGEGVEPGSVTFSWTADTAKSATTDAAGNIIGDAVGTVDWGTGEANMIFSDPPDPGTTVEAQLNANTSGLSYSESSPTPDASGYVTGTLPGAPLEPGAVNISWSYSKRGIRSRGIGSGGNMVRTFSYRRYEQDDGAGGFVGRDGTINYTTGEFSIKAVDEYTYSVLYYRGGEWTFHGNKTTWESMGSLTARYHQDGASFPSQPLATFTLEEIKFPINDAAGGWWCMPHSLRFKYGGYTHYDLDGVVYREHDTQTGAGVSVGSINYDEREVTLTTWGASPGNTVDVDSLVLGRGSAEISEISWRTPGRPVRINSLQITAIRSDTGETITGQSDAQGDIITAAMQGTIDYETGVVALEFTDGTDPIPVYDGTIRYNAVIQSFLPLDADLIGINPVRLPPDGKVPIFRDGGVAILNHWQNTDAGTPTAGETVTLSRDHNAEIQVVDVNDVAMDPAQYTADLVAGTVTFADPLTLQDAEANPLTTPITIRDRIEHMSVVTDTQVSGALTLLAPLAHEYPADETIVSSAVLWGDINARVYNEFTQKTWNSSDPNWTSERIGDDTTANYDLVNFPIEVTNDGAITEKWAIVFTSSSSFEVVGETSGIIATGNTGADLEPSNVNTGTPLFTIRAGGWGSGWAAGNVLRFDTDGCLAPLWISRTVLAGEATQEDDEFSIQVRGDAE